MHELKPTLSNHELSSDDTSTTNSSTTPTSDPQPKQEHPILEIIRFFIIALIIVIPIRMFIAQPFIVSGASMEQTFFHNEYLIVDQLSYHINNPKRGDVAIFRYPQDPSKFFIKRVIALPGDTITIDGDRVIITNIDNPEGIIIDEPYITQMDPTTFTKETLGEREYFVMGDNRNESSDSRVWGVLQEEHLIGRALLRLFPPSTISFMPGAHQLLNDN